MAYWMHPDIKYYDEALMEGIRSLYRISHRGMCVFDIFRILYKNHIIDIFVFIILFLFFSIRRFPLVYELLSQSYFYI